MLSFVRLAAALLLVGVAPVAVTAPQPTAATDLGSEEWRPASRSLLDFLDAGYELISVVTISPQQRAYFALRGPSLVKCSEQAWPSEPPPPPGGASRSGTPPAALSSDTAAGNRAGSPALPAGGGPKAMRTTARIECSELVRTGTSGRAAR